MIDSFLMIRLHSRSFCLERREWRLGQCVSGERRGRRNDARAPKRGCMVDMIWPARILS